MTLLVSCVPGWTGKDRPVPDRSNRLATCITVFQRRTRRPIHLQLRIWVGLNSAVTSTTLRSTDFRRDSTRADSTDFDDLLTTDRRSFAPFTPEALAAALFSASRCPGDSQIRFSDALSGAELEVLSSQALKSPPVDPNDPELQIFLEANPSVDRAVLAPFTQGDVRPYIGFTKTGGITSSCGGLSVPTIPIKLIQEQNYGEFSLSEPDPSSVVVYSIGGMPVGDSRNEVGRSSGFAVTGSSETGLCDLTSDLPNKRCYLSSVAFMYRGALVCSAALVSRGTVVTAAHCFCPANDNERAQDLSIIIGSHIAGEGTVELELKARPPVQFSFPAENEPPNTFCKARKAGITEAAQFGDVVAYSLKEPVPDATWAKISDRAVRDLEIERFKYMLIASFGFDENGADGRKNLIAPPQNISLCQNSGGENNDVQRCHKEFEFVLTAVSFKTGHMRRR